MRQCRICLEEKDECCFNRHFKSPGSGFKRLCKVCQYSQMVVLNRLKKQHIVPALGAACDICGAQHLRLCLDHDHASEAKRGFLCAPCNKGIGMLQDNPIILEKAIEYLRCALETQIM